MLLERINNPGDLKKLSLEQLPRLAAEIRARIIDVVSRNGGHLASSLGAVELIIALHYCFDPATDRIIFDVGHQAYAHKILTGRNKDFASMRTYRGLSGFPCKDESSCDVFTTGHSSTAVSLALGIACARDYQAQGKPAFKVIAVIGDGSLSGGLCFEGLNNTGHLKKDILVILNTNELSIAANTGAISTYLNKIISLPIYNRFHDSLENFIKSRLPRGGRLLKLANKFEEGLKGLFIPGMLFEELGFRYFGPFDGHDIGLLTRTLKNVATIKGPRIIHVVTKKGKGYVPAEKDPVRFHGTGPFEIESGRPLAKTPAGAQETYTGLFSKKIVDLAARDKSIVAVTAAMPEGTGLDKFCAMYPERFFDVGIAESHAVCFAAGLARAGLKPIVAIYSTFLQRAYDQIMEEAALQKLPVVFAVDRAGIAGEDGVTHQGIFDINFLRSIPGMTLMAPKDGPEFAEMLEFALKADGPQAIRYPKSVLPQLNLKKATPLERGKAEVLMEGKDFTLIALGSMVAPALEAMEELAKDNLSGTLINARFIKPLDTDLYKLAGAEAQPIFSVEDGVLEGGFGSAVEENIGRAVTKIGLPSEFVTHGKREILLEIYGLTGSGIAEKIKNSLDKK
ncbi:MAG: 1-deoxy-D-xylulose-5-phosphate synthase [Candidatus Omnitrophota bacterium]|nr:1-deoxy-D-xylulose-5-phosphate synthase [Candidatus Omnitrophota bacterium]